MRFSPNANRLGLPLTPAANGRPPPLAGGRRPAGRPRPTPAFVRSKLLSGHDVTAAEIDAGGGEGAVRLLGGGRDRDGSP